MSNPFVRDNEVDKPGIVGARWWNNAVVESASTQGRRVALAVLAASVVGAAAGGGGDEGTREESQKSLKLQQDFGWNFDVPTQTVAFDAAHTKEYVRSALATLADDLAPARSALAPFYASTLFQSPEALPKVKLPDGSNADIRPIAEALRPINTPSMIEAEAIGRALAALVTRATEPTGVIVDIDGPEAVAFASGAAGTHDVVFVFDNWPHPYGVVKAHLTLAAAVYHQAALREAKAKRAQSAQPLFVLDRGRLAPYTDSPTEFDNRYLAKLPPAATVAGQLGLKRLLYVAPAGSASTHSTDLATTFAEYRANKIDVRAVALTAFYRGPGGAAYYFGGTKEREDAFFELYGWGTAPATADKTNPATNDAARQWSPPASASVDPSLVTLGVTTVAVGLATGYVLGRSGSWNRAPSGGWGGG